MRLLMLLAAVAVAAPQAQPQPQPQSRLIGDWIMELYIGSQVFHDEVSVRPGAGGALGGTLTVPGRFTAPLDLVTEDGEAFALEITADEGRGPFKVRYDARFHGADDVFVGFATLPDQQGKLLGGFVGRRR